VDEQDGEVEQVKVCDRYCRSSHAVGGDEPRARMEDAGRDFVPGGEGGEAERPRHEPVAEVVDVSGPAPPAGRQQTAARMRLDVGEVRHLGIVGVGAEGILLAVARTEDVVAGQLHGGNHHEVDGAEHDGVHAQVASLQAIDERDPRQVSEGKHEAEAVGGDVHGGKDGGLHPQRVEHVPRLREGHDQHGVGDVAVGSILLGHEGQVQHNPAEQAGPQLHEGLDVDFNV